MSGSAGGPEKGHFRLKKALIRGGGGPPLGVKKTKTGRRPGKNDISRYVNNGSKDFDQKSSVFYSYSNITILLREMSSFFGPSASLHFWALEA